MKTALKKNKNFIKRVIDKEVLLMPLMQSSKDEFLYSLNESAATVWDLLDETNKIEEIASRLKKRYSTPESELNKKLSSIIKEFKEIKAII
jgi:hypothetical protein